MIDVDVFREIRIEIPGKVQIRGKLVSGPPSLNARRHWRSIARDNDDWKMVALHAATDAIAEWQGRRGLAWRKLQKVALSVTFVVPTKARQDVDNRISTLKPLLDGIVDAGVIEDDSFAVIAYFEVSCTYRQGERWIILTIAEIGDETEPTV